MGRTLRIRPVAFAAAATTGAALVLAGCGDDTGPDNGQNALQPKGEYAKQILDLTRPFFWIAVAVGIGVVAGTIFVAVRFRQKPGGEERMPHQTHGNTALEVGWTIVPALILAVMAVPTVATIFSLAEKPKGDVLNVTVEGRQWWWQFTYEDGSKIVTANELHMQTGQPLLLTQTGPPLATQSDSPTQQYNNGVLHSFWIPELNGKKDIVPGRKQTNKFVTDRPGTYLGQCAEYCGSSHANMRMRVIVHTPEDFAKWQASQKLALSSDQLQAGVNNQAYGCAGCHSFQVGVPGAVGPNLTKLADRDAFAGDIFEMNYDNLWRWIHNAPSMKPSGDLQGWMPDFSVAYGPPFPSPAMSEQEAQQIACFLLKNTASTPERAAEVSKGCPS